MKVYSSQKAHHFPPRYRYIDTVTGEMGEETLPPGGVVDEFEYRWALLKILNPPQPATRINPPPAEPEPSAPTS